MKFTGGGVGRSLDGAASLDETLGVALKVREDIDRVRREKVLEGA